ncbi:MAG: di-trans,poly-cis-decaprenylcistransferase [Elusimicrobia bacterium RIFCSPLOWO2_01_FULL_59_12]|nr:MAG: di-trans,poly-cis-decaprenylcistransferase [Elusimicrobia bacterium RIFCSPLOWO2_01_FULL_59_12]
MRSAPSAEQDLLQQINADKLPKHIAIIMDGNGRWAKQRHLPRVFGHRAGISSVREVVRACGQLGVKVLTLYAFSAENWSRPGAEVAALMRLLEDYLQRELPDLQKNHVQLRAIGRWDALPSGARRQLERVIEATSKNRGLILTLALNYGGRQEIVDACNRALKSGARQVNEESLSRCLNTHGLPDPDLLIRTSGEMRISNFLLWQLAYTEIYVTDTPWPEFRRPHLYRALLDFQRRERRFGGL